MMLIIFDLDQTLVRPIPGVTVPNNLLQQEFIPGVLDRCAKLREEGATLAIASNQGGVSLGLCTLAEAVDRVEYAAAQIGAKKWLMCIYHANATMNLRFFHMPYRGIVADEYYRKPNPGMLLLHMHQLRATAPDALFVGDQESDCEAARNAGVPFAWAKDFFGWT